MWTFGGAGKRHEPRESEETRGNQRVLRNIGSHKPPFLPPPSPRLRGRKPVEIRDDLSGSPRPKRQNAKSCPPTLVYIEARHVSIKRKGLRETERTRVSGKERLEKKNDHVTQPGALTSSVPGSRSEASQVRVSSLATRTMCYWHHFVPPTYMHIQSDPYGVRTRCRYIVVLRGPPVAHNT